MELDFATLNFAAGLASLLAALAVTVLAAGHPRESALRWFAGAAIAGALGLSGFWLLDPPRPVIPRILCNLLLIGDLAAILAGVYLFSERSIRPWRLTLATVAAATTGFAVIWLLGDAFIARLWLFALFASGLGAAIAVALTGDHWRDAELERWPGARLVLCVVFAGHALFQLARAGAVTAEGADAVRQWLSPGMIHLASTVDAIVLTAVFAWGVAALHGQKVASALHRLAHRDALTALPNRNAFVELFDGPRGLGAGDEPNVIAVLDLDDFKSINDSYGHVAGDAFLEEVARRLATDLRPGDTLARLGGDEFVLLMRGVDSAIAANVLRRLVADLDQIPVEQDTARASCSVGLALQPTDGTDFESLYRAADNRLYHAKRHGNARGVLPSGEVIELHPGNSAVGVSDPAGS